MTFFRSNDRSNEEKKANEENISVQMCGNIKHIDGESDVKSNISLFFIFQNSDDVEELFFSIVSINIEEEEDSINGFFFFSLHR